MSLPHVIFFVTSWLQKATGVKQLRNVQIKRSDIKTKCKIAQQELQQGSYESKLRFNPTIGSLCLAAVVVLVSFGTMSVFQKYDLKNPLELPIAKTLCDSQIDMGMISVKNVQTARSATLIETNMEHDIDETESHSFVLPFKTTNDSLLHSDRASTLLKSKMDKHVRNGDYSELARYFENSLKDKITKQLVIHGMDFATLKPRQCLNDAVLNFWFQWVTIQRTRADNTSKIHICSTYFLSGVLNDGGYTDRYQRWLKNVDIFEKKMVLFPVHLAHHWSLVAVLNPRNIRQTKAKWSVREYTNDVTALIHLDPLGFGTVHDKYHLGRAVRDILNTEWDRHCNYALDQRERPFNHRHDACRLRSPTGKCKSC